MSWSWCNRVQQCFRAARSWPYFQLPRWLVGYVAAVVIADAAAIAVAARVSVIRPSDVLIFGLLVICAGVTVEMTRRIGESAVFFKDICGVWELPAAILLPPLFALLAPLARVALMQLRGRKIGPHRRMFSAAAISLSYGCVSVVFHQLSGPGPVSLTGSGVTVAGWILAVAVCGVLQWTVNSCFLIPAVKGSDRSVSIRQMLLGRESMHNDLMEISVATVVAVGVAVSPITLVFALPFVSLLQRSMRHTQLLDASRMDAKTGVLNAVTWRRESSLELARAQRTGTSLAVALIDVDHFKAVNDVHGHLAGDDALRAICQTIQLAVREYDLVGRFGGEEFSLLMPQTDAAGAMAIAERVRAQVAELHVESDSAASGEPVRLTVSIGVAVLGRSGAGVTELLSAADAGLYRAKKAGRNQVQVTTDAELASQADQQAAFQELPAR